MKWGARTGALLAAGALIALVMLTGVLRGRAGRAATAPAPSPALSVPVVAVRRSTVPLYLDYVGTTDAIRSVTLQAQATGYLERYAVRDGAEVRRGQLLYQIDPRSYQAALDQARAQAQRDRAAHQYATANRVRNEGLARTGDVSIDALQLSTSTEHQDAAAEAADQAAIESAQLNLGYTAIRAPFDGRLSLTLVHEGALITVAGTQLNTLVQLDPIYATFNPPDSDLPRIEQAQARAPIPAEVLTANSQQPAYQGQVTFVDNAVDRNTGTVTTRATIANPHHTLLPGEFIRVRLHIGQLPDALLIPQIAVQTSQLGQYVFVIGPANRVEQRTVTLGPDEGASVVVTQGLHQGEWVATGNLLRLNAGQTVRPVHEAAAAQGARVAAPAGGQMSAP